MERVLQDKDILQTSNDILNSIRAENNREIQTKLKVLKSQLSKLQLQQDTSSSSSSLFNNSKQQQQTPPTNKSSHALLAALSKLILSFPNSNNNLKALAGTGAIIQLLVTKYKFNDVHAWAVHLMGFLEKNLTKNSKHMVLAVQLLTVMYTPKHQKRLESLCLKLYFQSPNNNNNQMQKAVLDWMTVIYQLEFQTHFIENLKMLSSASLPVEIAKRMDLCANLIQYQMKKVVQLPIYELLSLVEKHSHYHHYHSEDETNNNDGEVVMVQCSSIHLLKTLLQFCHNHLVPFTKILTDLVMSMRSLMHEHTSGGRGRGLLSKMYLDTVICLIETLNPDNSSFTKFLSKFIDMVLSHFPEEAPRLFSAILLSYSNFLNMKLRTQIDRAFVSLLLQTATTTTTTAGRSSCLQGSITDLASNILVVPYADGGTSCRYLTNHGLIKTVEKLALHKGDKFLKHLIDSLALPRSHPLHEVQTREIVVRDFEDNVHAVVAVMEEEDESRSSSYHSNKRQFEDDERKSNEDSITIVDQRKKKMCMNNSETTIMVLDHTNRSKSSENRSEDGKKTHGDSREMVSDDKPEDPPIKDENIKMNDSQTLKEKEDHKNAEGDNDDDDDDDSIPDIEF